MQSYLPDQDITVTLDLSTLAMAPVSVSYRVVDELDTELVPMTVVAGFDPTVTDLPITIPAASNAMTILPAAFDTPGPVVQSLSARTVIAYVTGTGGIQTTSIVRLTYALRAEQQLVIPRTSFQTLTSADMVASSLFHVDAFIAADDQTRINALIQARNQLVRLRYYWLPEDWQRRVSIHIELSEYWFNSMVYSEWATMDNQFKEAMHRAQVVQADYMLRSDADAENKLAGVINVKVGESSRTYSGQRTMASKLPICETALKILNRFIAPHRLTRIG